MPEPRPSLALIGGEEFADGFEDVHAELLEGRSRVVYLPTCAAHDGPEVVEHWCNLARERLSATGARVETPRVIDRQSAHDPDHARLVAEADVVYIGGGHPNIGMDLLAGTPVLSALFRAAEAGALIAGASAGAMIMCARSFVITPELDQAFERILSGAHPEEVDLPVPPSIECLGLVPQAICIPHFDSPIPWQWLKDGLLPDNYTLIGVDEQTALVRRSDCWHALGRGVVTLGGCDWEPERYAAGKVPRALGA
jgi:cyanophycinase